MDIYYETRTGWPNKINLHHIISAYARDTNFKIGITGNPGGRATQYDDYEEMIVLYETLSSKHARGTERLLTDYYWEVYPGCWVLSSVGELRQTSLKQIINSKEYRKRVQDIFLKKCPGCVCDYILNLYAHVPAVVEEVQWRLKLRSIIRR